jgi:iron complex transport system substrate-binding protein
MKRNRLALYLGLALVGLLAACGAATPPPAAGLTVTDALGRTVTLPGLPQRIATAGRGVFMLNDALFLFPEAAPRLVALGKASQEIQDFFPLLDANIDQKTLFEVQVSAEQIVPVQPDLVILKSYMAESLGRPLEELGIPVLYLELEQPEQYARDLLILGQVLGNEPRARELGAYFQAQLDRVDRALQGLPEGDKPRVLLLQYSESGGTVEWRVPPAGWIQTTLTERAGGVPVWLEAAPGGGWGTVNLEQIAAWAPDWIGVIQYAGDPAGTVARLQADAQWQQLGATQAGRLVAFPKDFVSWDQPDPRWALGLTWLAATLHPERFAVDMEQEVLEFYREIYGLDEDAIRAEVLPRLVIGDW